MMYTVCLDMSRAHCLVVGMGKVGVRKLTRLLCASPASVLVLDPHPLSEEAGLLCEHPCVRYEARTFVKADVQACFFVVAATNDPELNKRIAFACRENAIPCNCITTPHEGSAIVPAVVEHKGITCSITTHGASPALTKRLRQELKVWLEEKASPLPLCMARLRPYILREFDDEMLYKRENIFHILVASDLAMFLQQGDGFACKMLLQELLPDSLHFVIDEVLDGLI